jgi:hypothetical protein
METQLLEFVPTEAMAKDLSAASAYGSYLGSP